MATRSSKVPAIVDDQTYAPISADSRSARSIEREFRRLLDAGHQLEISGSASSAPESLLRSGFYPKSKLTLFGADIYLTRPRQNPDLRFFVAYVAQRRKLYARIFYKDISLIWRAASHIFVEGDELWIGKGDTRTDRRGDYEYEESAEWTTDLPFEMQTAVEYLNRAKNVRHEFAVLAKVLKPGSRNRIRAFPEFTAARTRAEKAGRLVYGGEKVVFFETMGDPSTLVVVDGFEPDWDRGLVETYSHPSRLYDGAVRRFRFLSVNRQIQHLMFMAPDHMWMIPPQALTTDLTSFAVRTVDVNFDEEAYVPGYEYHFEEEGGEDEDPLLHSQIPEGYVGALSEIDDSRADASAWLNEIPLLKEFRRRFG